MKTTPRFSIGERVQASIDNCPLEGVGKVREILIDEGGVWGYEVEPEGADWLRIKETELGPVDSPATRQRAREERIVHHAREARRLADEATEEAVGPPATHKAALSQAHGLASIASVLAESSVGIDQ